VISTMRNMFKVADLRNKILFTLLIIAIYRFGAHVPVPGIDLEQLQILRDQARSGGGVLQLLGLFSGGALTNFAVFALGIMPYITASIIMQVLTVVIPRLEQWQAQGAVGQRKITQWTRYLTIGIAVLQATSFTFIFSSGGGGFVTGADLNLLPDWSIPRVLIIVITMTAGTAIIMWMGESVTQRGIGNGMSLIIFASVVSSFPAQGDQIRLQSGWGMLLVVVAILILILAAIVFVEQGQRRIPVQFAKRVVGRRQYGGQNTYIPLKINQSGVIPVIFASSVLYLPIMGAQVLPSEGWGASVQRWVDTNLIQPDNIFYVVIFGLMIIGFAYFYTSITFDPAKQADTLRKQGGFIPGIRPGPQTERHLSRILSRIVLPGALFIAFVALVPDILLANILPGDEARFAFGGISLLIAVGVSLETMKQIDSQLMMRNYEGFLK
jgi:preprotein translocase subunit SecY